METTSSDGGLTVVNGNWGRASLASILAVLESAFRVLTTAFGDYLDSWCSELLGDGLGVRPPDVVRGLLIPGTG